MDKLLEMNLALFTEAEDFMKKHWNDKDFGDVSNKESAIYEYQVYQARHKGSQWWQDLLLVVIDNLEKKYKYCKAKDEKSDK